MDYCCGAMDGNEQQHAAIPSGFGMLARIPVRSCENVRVEHLGKATLPK
jgi:hypothetical protein